MNNLSVYSPGSTAHANYFGFTEDEVKELFKQSGRSDELTPVKRWYNGWVFLRCYTPIIAMLHTLAK